MGIFEISALLFHRDLVAVVPKQRVEAGVDNDEVCLGILLGEVDVEAYFRKLPDEDKLVNQA
jgi:hypothetical protein